MNVLAKNIEYLLLSHNSVIVPSLGAFRSTLTPARWIEGESLFLPPVRNVHFDPSNTYDPEAVFLESLAEVYNLTPEEAIKRCDEMVADFHRTLVTDGCVDFGSIGIFTLEDDAEITMASCECGVITPAYYGLDVLHFCKLSDKALNTLDTQTDPAEEVVEKQVPETTEPDLDKEHGTTETPDAPVQEVPFLVDRASVISPAFQHDKENMHFVIRIRKSVFRYACIIIFAILTFLLIKPTPVTYSFGSQMAQTQMFLQPNMVLPAANTDNLEEQEPIIEDTTDYDAILTDITDEVSNEGYDFDTVREQSEEQTVMEKNKEEAPKASVTVKTEIPKAAEAKTVEETFCIVLASQVSRANAEEFVKKLKQRNIPAKVMERGKMRRVIIEGYSSNDTAHKALDILKATHSDLKGAWVLKL